MQQARRHRHPLRNASALTFILTLVLFASATLSPRLLLAQPEESITGEYAVTLVRVDVPTDLPDGYNYVGKWIIQINEDGTYSATRQDVGLLVSGMWEATGNQVTFTDDTGLVSCTNATAVTIPGDDISSGTYEWTLTGDELQLIPVDEGCGGRLLLLATRLLGPYVPCLATPLDEADGLDGDAVTVPVASPEAAVDEILTPDDPSNTGTRGGSGSQNTEQQGQAPQVDDDVVTSEIDALLDQMTACWSTGDPELWLPLLSDGFRESLIGNDPDFLITIQSAMALPIIWERAGDVEIESATSAFAIVRTTIDQEQDFQRFGFVVEDGEWRWDG
ncbi:MAG: hypothetical protein AB7V46_11505 [Thermomicrobiales bacterium]